MPSPASHTPDLAEILNILTSDASPDQKKIAVNSLTTQDVEAAAIMWRNALLAEQRKSTFTRLAGQQEASTETPFYKKIEGLIQVALWSLDKETRTHLEKWLNEVRNVVQATQGAEAVVIDMEHLTQTLQAAQARGQSRLNTQELLSLLDQMVNELLPQSALGRKQQEEAFFTKMRYSSQFLQSDVKATPLPKKEKGGLFGWREKNAGQREEKVMADLRAANQAIKELLDRSTRDKDSSAIDFTLLKERASAVSSALNALKEVVPRKKWLNGSYGALILSGENSIYLAQGLIEQENQRFFDQVLLPAVVNKKAMQKQPVELNNALTNFVNRTDEINESFLARLENNAKMEGSDAVPTSEAFYRQVETLRQTRQFARAQAIKEAAVLGAGVEVSSEALSQPAVAVSPADESMKPARSFDLAHVLRVLTSDAEPEEKKALVQSLTEAEAEAAARTWAEAAMVVQNGSSFADMSSKEANISLLSRFPTNVTRLMQQAMFSLDGKTRAKMGDWLTLVGNNLAKRGAFSEAISLGATFLHIVPSSVDKVTEDGIRDSYELQERKKELNPLSYFAEGINDKVGIQLQLSGKIQTSTQDDKKSAERKNQDAAVVNWAKQYHKEGAFPLDVRAFSRLLDTGADQKLTKRSVGSLLPILDKMVAELPARDAPNRKEIEARFFDEIRYELQSEDYSGDPEKDTDMEKTISDNTKAFFEKIVSAVENKQALRQMIPSSDAASLIEFVGKAPIPNEALLKALRMNARKEGETLREKSKGFLGRARDRLGLLPQPNDQVFYEGVTAALVGQDIVAVTAKREALLLLGEEVDASVSSTAVPKKEKEAVHTKKTFKQCVTELKAQNEAIEKHAEAFSDLIKEVERNPRAEDTAVSKMVALVEAQQDLKKALEAVNAPEFQGKAGTKTRALIETVNENIENVQEIIMYAERLQAGERSYHQAQAAKSVIDTLVTEVEKRQTKVQRLQEKSEEEQPSLSVEMQKTETELAALQATRSEKVAVLEAEKAQILAKLRGLNAGIIDLNDGLKERTKIFIKTRDDYDKAFAEVEVAFKPYQKIVHEIQDVFLDGGEPTASQEAAHAAAKLEYENAQQACEATKPAFDKESQALEALHTHFDARQNTYQEQIAQLETALDAVNKQLAETNDMTADIRLVEKQLGQIEAGAGSPTKPKNK